MVSLRRRKLLGLCTGVQNSFLAPLPILSKNKISSDNNAHDSNPGCVYPVPFVDLKIRVEDGNDPLGEISQSEISDSGHSYDQHKQSSISGSTFSNELDNRRSIEPDVKRRKQHRRRRINNQEQSVLRGVYLKNMKWQAAIKVDKKQIHLGTVSSQEEAARLYDRAAFMCGREPNFDLPEEEKQQLKKLKWDEFLALTRGAIASKRMRRTRVAPSFQKSDWLREQGTEDFSVSDDTD